MPALKKLLKLDKIKFYETHLSFINCLLVAEGFSSMTPTETQILARFMSLEGDIAALRFGPSARKLIQEQFGLSPAGLSNHLKSLTNKGFLKKKGDIMEIWPVLEPHKELQDYEFRLMLEPTVALPAPT